MDRNINAEPLVSVVMPVYNCEKYISEAIESILNQTYKNLELIVVDDGSTDGSREIIDKIAIKDNRLKIFSHKKNKGISKALNKAISNSKGKYIARLDSDDVSLPQRLEKQVYILEKNTEIGVCGTRGIAINEKGERVSYLNTLTGHLLNYNYWKPSPFISSSSMIRKSIFKGELFDSRLDTVEDYDMWLRLKKYCRFFNLRQQLVLYRINSEGVSNKKFHKQRQLSKKAFSNNLNIRLTLDEYLSFVCLEFKMKPWLRYQYLVKLSKQINYPWFMILIDNLYYSLRKFMYGCVPRQYLIK